MPPKLASKEGPTKDLKGPLEAEITAQIGKKRGRPPNLRKKKRPSVHPLFTGRGRRALFHAERGFIHCYHLMKPELSIADLAATFNVSDGLVRGIITTTLTNYEEYQLANRGRSAAHSETIEARMQELDKIRHKDMSTYKLAEELTSRGFPCSANTVRSDLWDLGIRCRAISVRPWKGSCGEAVWRERRYDFCKAVRSLGNNIVFSDESIIRCTQNKGFCWVRPGSEEVTTKETNRWAANCHVWAAIGQNGFVAWVDVTGAPLCKKDYVEMIKSNFVVPYKRQKRRYPGTVFMQDEASIHRAAEEELNEEGVNVLPSWPPHSPDLNPIENLWANMKRELGEEIGRDLSQTNTNKLRIRALVGDWLDDLKKNRKEVVNNLIASFQRRVTDCYNSKGAMTRY